MDTSQVGVGSYSDGSTPPLRSGRLQDLIVSELRARFAEDTTRGNVYSLIVTNTTGIAAGNVTGAAAAASTQFAIWNPLSSGVNIELIEFTFGVVSGTIVGGPLIHNFFSSGLPSIASVGTAYSMKGGAAFSGQAKFVASAAGTTLTAGSALTAGKYSTITYSAGTYAALMGSVAAEMVDGKIVLPPGTGWVPCVAAAGTTVLAAWGATWAEKPV